VNDGRGRLQREPRRFGGQFAPGCVRIDAVLRHGFGDARETHDRGRNVPSFRKRDQSGLYVARIRIGAGPSDLEQMPMRRCGSRLAIDDQYLEPRERQVAPQAPERTIGPLGRAVYTWFRNISSTGCGCRYTWPARYGTPQRRM